MYFTKEELKLIVGTFDDQGKLVAGSEGALVCLGLRGCPDFAWLRMIKDFPFV
jgi:hypothetical protein